MRLADQLAESSSGILGSPMPQRRRTLPPPPPPEERPPPPPPPTDDEGCSLRTWCVTFNVGNRKLLDDELPRWLPARVEDCDVVVVGLQESRYLSETQRRSLKVVAGCTAVGAAGGAGVGAAAGMVLGAGAAGAMALQARAKGTTKMTDSHLWKAVSEYLDLLGFGEAVQLEWGQMRLLVFASRATVDDVVVEREVVSRVGGYVNVDVPAGWLGNKGGLAAKVRVALKVAPGSPYFRPRRKSAHFAGRGLREGRTEDLDARLSTIFDRARFHATDAPNVVSLGLLSVHLPAHEGKAAERADVFRKITDECGAALSGVDVRFVLGDLNSRLGDRAPPRDALLDAVNRSLAGDGEPLKLVYRRDDELVSALARAGYAKADPLRGLVTPPCDFPPTFKCVRDIDQAGLVAYSPKRLPSWTDRVLYQVNQRKPGTRCTLVVDAYASCPAVSTSDHKPVVMRATVTLRERRTPSPTPLQEGVLLDLRAGGGDDD